MAKIGFDIVSENIIHADVEVVTPLTDSVLQFILKPNKYIDYNAGQYLKIVTEHDAYCYSIANAPLGAHRYELHIRHCRDNAKNQDLLEDMKRNGRVNICLPFGYCSIKDLDALKPIIFIAAGSGFAPIKAMIEQLFANDDPRKMELYWGVHTQSDLYMHEKVMAWQKHTRNLSYTPHTSKLNNKILISLLFENHPHDLSEYQIVMSGPFDLMYSMRDALIAKGVQINHMFSDAFNFESR